MRFPALLLACAAFLLSSSALHAQRLFDLGLKGGVNMDDLSTTFSHTAIVGGNFGVFAKQRKYDRWTCSCRFSSSWPSDLPNSMQVDITPAI